MDDQRKYSDEEVARILEHATEVQTTSGRSLTHAEDSGGTSLADLKQIGEEVGISPDLIAQAAAALDRPGDGEHPERTVWGVPIGVGRTVHLPRKLTDKEWHRLVVDLRETFQAKGRIEELGEFRSWTNGNLQALLEPDENDGQRLRLVTTKGSAGPNLAASAGMFAVGIGGMIALSVKGAELGAIVAMAMMATAALFMGGSQVFTLPKWADTRAEQMRGIANRVLSTINLNKALPAGSEPADPSSD